MGVVHQDLTLVSAMLMSQKALPSQSRLRATWEFYIQFSGKAH